MVSGDRKFKATTGNRVHIGLSYDKLILRPSGLTNQKEDFADYLSIQYEALNPQGRHQPALEITI